MKKSISYLVLALLCAHFAVNVQAQTPGGVAGAALWLRADKGPAITSFTPFNVAAGSRTSNGNCCTLVESLSVMSSTSSWAAAAAAPGYYITMDLGSDQLVNGVITKGRGDFGQWVTAYTVTYATAAAPGTFISLGSFTGNTNAGTQVDRTFTPVTGRYVRIYPTAFSLYIALRADVISTVSTGGMATDGQVVSTWENQANISKSFAVNNGAPAFKNTGSNLVNFNPTILFATNDFYVSPTGIFGLLATNATFYEGKSTSTSPYGTMLWSGATSTHPRITMVGKPGEIYQDVSTMGSGCVMYNGTEPASYNQWSAMATSQATNFRRMYLNGGVKAQNSAAYTANNDLTAYPTYLGYNPSNSGNFSGNFAEMISYPTDLILLFKGKRRRCMV